MTRSMSNWAAASGLVTPDMVAAPSLSLRSETLVDIHWLSMYIGLVGNTDLLRGHLDGLLLAVLAEAPGHGYELARRVHRRSGGDVGVPEGSMYPALHRLEGGGVV